MFFKKLNHIVCINNIQPNIMESIEQGLNSIDLHRQDAIKRHKNAKLKRNY